MTDIDAFIAETVPDLMIDRARSIDRLHVKNSIGGADELADLTDAEYEAVVDRVLDAIETADITIDVNGA